nr:MAG TPA: hypothetical protein [Caudoviricetes sp.]
MLILTFLIAGNISYEIITNLCLKKLNTKKFFQGIVTILFI